MSSPWLTVPLADYEGHMKSPGVGQLDVLSELFANALAYCRPGSVAILGIAGGNGLGQIDLAVTHRVVGVDINAAYLEAVRQRYSSMRGLELHCVDLANDVLDVEPAQLVHASLLFEHTGVERCLENAISLVARGGYLCAVLQLPSEVEPGVGSTGFLTIQNLKHSFALVDPGWFQAALEQSRFQLKQQTRCSLPGGKGLWLGMFRRE